MGCHRAVGGAADKVGPDVVCAMERCVISVSHIHQSVSHLGGCAGILVCVCVCFPAGD